MSQVVEINGEQSKAFAYVRFHQDGVTYVAEAKDIKRFDPTNLEKSYKVLYSDRILYYRAKVVCLGDSREEVSKIGGSKRGRIPNIRLYESSQDSQDEGAEIIPTNKKTKNTKTKKVEASIKSQETSNFMKILEKKTLRTDLQPQPSTLNCSLEAIEKKYKDEIAVLKAKIARLEDINFKLQEKVIDKFQDLDATLSQKQVSIPQQPLDQKCHELSAVGISEGGEIHLGRGVFLPCTIYDTIDSRGPKKDGLFIKELAIAVFGTEVLAMSSVTGMASKKHPKHTAKPPLNQTLKMAICGKFSATRRKRIKLHRARFIFILNILKFIFC